ncbi:MAG TPA: CUAEP/CCAEP-tail radical SAM protein [Terriglobales bacterium]|nr:CUAEP/CCAEP-tail radical SAM protein [Terriglobales bacterium]
MKIALISTYELGRQPFGLASPAAWLRKRGHEVRCVDVSRKPLDEETVREAEMIGFYVPMHTAARMTVQCIEPLRHMNPKAHFCVFGLYARMNEAVFRKAGVGSVLGAEFEEQLAKLADEVSRYASNGKRSDGKGDGTIPRLKFEIPDRKGLPSLKKYAHLVLPNGEHRTTGYTEASRGCKHLCRHCPIVPVYRGVFRVVQPEVVLADIRQQVKAGAKHITFGDPDFFNGIKHAMRIVEALHKEFPKLTYDATIKIEHLRKHKGHLGRLRETGCLLVTSAVESLDDDVLKKLEKGHTRADFLEVLKDCRHEGLALQPTFVPFTPWTTIEKYLELLETLRECELEESVAPIQLGIRLLIPAGSRLLELGEIQKICGPFEEGALVHPWRHEDGRIDTLAAEVQEIVAAGERRKETRREIFARIRQAARKNAEEREELDSRALLADRATVPYLNEPWYC